MFLVISCWVMKAEMKKLLTAAVFGICLVGAALADLAGLDFRCFDFSDALMTGASLQDAVFISVASDFLRRTTQFQL